ncbi:MAG TPA: MGMT family protein [Steroidobacter sp.]|uniref:MGMT family protein n=1 Tax=Steroidobacter sp. TaxID=1978227 RepID=UPI002EDA4E45
MAARAAKAPKKAPRKASKKVTSRSTKRAAQRNTTRKRGLVIAPQSDAARIIAAVKRIPRGRVCTYGNVADVAGLPRRARLVGTVLRNTSVRGLPWFRVINASGRISFPQGSDAYARQRKHLEGEGVDFVGGRVDLKRYGWPPRDKMLDELLWGPG